MIAVVPVRQGTLPAGGLEAVATAGGRVVLVGEGTGPAVAELAGVAVEIRVWEAGDFAPGAWSVALAPLLAGEPIILLPASPDGRDLAPRLAAELDRPVLAGAVEVDDSMVTTPMFGGAAMADHNIAGPVVVTLQPGMRGVQRGAASLPDVETLVVSGPRRPDSTVEEVLAPDVSTMDLAEAPRILGGGAGLDSADRFVELASVAAALDASMGATRVITDRSWVAHSRQIGTTGVVVEPTLYLAFGISARCSTPRGSVTPTTSSA